MAIEIFPCRLSGEVGLPPSKSLTHRALFLASMSPDESLIFPWEGSLDLEASCRGLASLGAKIQEREGGLLVHGPLAGRGQGRESDEEPILIQVGESGTSLRFLIAQAMVMDRPVLFEGEGRVMDRPLSPYRDLFQSLGLVFEREGKYLRIKGPLKAGDFVLPGHISSQFLSGLLLALPRLEGRSRLKVTKPLVSRPYLQMTLDLMREFGLTYDLQEGEDEIIFILECPQEVRGRRLEIEGDYSNAPALAIFNAIGGRVTLKGLGKSTIQGDRVFSDHFSRLMEGDVTIDLTDTPDLAPLLFSLAAVQHGATFTGTDRLKDKESSRAEAMQKELGKLGISLTIGQDRVRVKSGEIQPPQVPLDSHGDHRLVMALIPLLTLTGGILTGEDAVEKSFPSYFQKLASLSLRYRHI